jgi:hypothetical protein
VRRKSEVIFLSGGKAWSSQGDAEQAKREVPPPSKGGAETSGDPGEVRADEQAGELGSLGKRRAAQPSRLAQANALLARSQVAAARGDDRTALAHLDELLKRFGDSPVAASARVERFRALKRLGRDSEAASAADEYLDKERDGVARDEARALGK